MTSLQNYGAICDKINQNGLLVQRLNGTVNMVTIANGPVLVNNNRFAAITVPSTARNPCIARNIIFPTLATNLDKNLEPGHSLWINFHCFLLLFTKNIRVWRSY